ncbi:hypothetical protein AAG570_006238 [Ranatra chinensis]|uniref:Uncharacterized protein n=1 Tax=Ranatra chinensis TaxID=642074 RepID=A0ABD0Z688_9HEMI
MINDKPRQVILEEDRGPGVTIEHTHYGRTQTWKVTVGQTVANDDLLTEFFPFAQFVKFGTCFRDAIASDSNAEESILGICREFIAECVRHSRLVEGSNSTRNALKDG